MKKLLTVVLLTIGILLNAQIIDRDNRWYEQITKGDTTEFVLMDSTSWAGMSLTYMISDSITYYVPSSAPDTIKVLVLITDDLSQYTDEELCWHSPIAYLERGYMVVDDYEYGNNFLNRKKKKYEHAIIWDWREYEW